MPVVPYCANLFQDRKYLYQFLIACQQKAIDRQQEQIASIAVEIDAVDPLAVLHEISTPDQLHFYLEKGFTGEAIAAVGTAESLTVDGSNRFSKTQKFIQRCLENWISSDTTPAAIAIPKFFCSFTFFDQKLNAESPFAAGTIFLPEWQITRHQNRCVVLANFVIHPKLNISALTEKIWQQFRKICSAKYGIFNLPDDIRKQLNRWEIIDTNNFKSAVLSALESIRTNQLNKLVLAHAVDVIAHLPFQWTHSLHNLRKLYPDCYVFSTSNGRGQNFIGASPERLISICDRTLITDALAGSAPRGRTLAEDAHLARQLRGSEKERREHQVVVDFISQRLAHFDLQPQLAAVPDLLQLSNIQHLHTPIQAALPAHLHPLEILAELHPTPAVAGLPRELACEQIRRYETFERSLYAAPLGWVDAQGDAEFIVGIRSALIQDCHARLYAGAGIVAGSNPAKELAEVKLKLQALLQALV